MAIPSLRFDNPIDIEKIPNDTLSFRQPAIGRPTEKLTWEYGIACACFLCLPQVIYNIYVHNDFRDNSHFVEQKTQLSVFCLMLYLTSLFLRPLIRHHYYVLVPLILGVGTGVLFIKEQIRGLPDFFYYCYALTAIVHWAVEVGFYLYSIDENNCKRTDSKEKLNATFNQMITAIGFSIVIIVVFFTLRLEAVGLLLASLVLVSIPLPKSKESPQSLVRAFRDRVESFLFYPSAGEISPGLIASPCGNFYLRFAMIGVLAAIAISPTVKLFCKLHAAQGLTWMAFIGLYTASLTRFLMLFPSSSQVDSSRSWYTMVRSLRSSSNRLERNAIHLGNVAADNSPVLIDRSLCMEHMHILGATGNNKTSVGLAPLIEQLASFDDTSIVIVDLKGDTPELYHAARIAVEEFRRESSIQYFALENNQLSQVYNPFHSAAWDSLSLLERSDVLCTALGLVYGFEYAKAFFTMGNSTVMTNINAANPGARSFRQLATEVDKILNEENAMSSEMRKIGLHAIESIRRLSCYDTLNYTSTNPESDEVFQNRIDLAYAFTKPSVFYFKLPSPVSEFGSSVIARFIIQNLLFAGRRVNRKCKVHLVIDEFQRAIGEGIDATLQMARSNDIGLVLANQSMADLWIKSPKVYQAVAGNCAVRRWFSVNSQKDIEELMMLMGTTEVEKSTVTRGNQGRSVSYTTEHEPRVRVTDLHAISENSELSILQVSGRGRGYARYSGTPFIAQSEYHISETDYQDRKQMPWPTNLPGMIPCTESHDILLSSRSESKKKTPQRDSARGNARGNDIFSDDFFR
ncbi:MAG: TraM recognition domain-containing protein [Planctomycetes bacterium]|nr:TraM recognition domain-containing protein [Planctomycetota bacterium]